MSDPRLELHDDALLDFRDGVLAIQHGDRIVSLRVKGPREADIFANGPLTWRQIKTRYLHPLLLNVNPKSSREAQ